MDKQTGMNKYANARRYGQTAWLQNELIYRQAY